MIWKRILYSFLWILALASVVVLMGFAHQQQQNIKLKSIEINIIGENFFLEKDQVNDILYNNNRRLVGESIHGIPVELLENEITSNPYVLASNVYIDIDGTMRIKLKQREPLMRVINESYRSFYIDKNGLKMPLSENFTARVLVANGFIDEGYGTIDSLNTSLIKDLYQLANFISNDEFWKAQIGQIFVNANKEIELIPRVGNHRILLGDVQNMELKFRNLMLFYKEALPRVGWEKYKTLNLKYHNQIVCIKDTINN